MDILVRIKRLVMAGKVRFTEKAQAELWTDGLTEGEVCEAILNAPAINKVIRSRRPMGWPREKLYVIIGSTYDGMLIYTKGRPLKVGPEEVFYVLVSSKWATRG